MSESLFEAEPLQIGKRVVQMGGVSGTTASSLPQAGQALVQPLIDGTPSGAFSRVCGR